MFFSLHCIVLGVLIYQCIFLPRLFGVLMVLAGLGYGLSGFGNLLFSEYKMVYAAIVAIGALIGEIPFMLRVLFRGVKVDSY